MAQKYEYYDTGGDGVAGCFADRRYAQTFTPSTSHVITSVKLLVYRVGNPGTVTISIRETDEDGHPTGDDLCAGTIYGNALTEDPAGEWKEITLGDGYNLTPSTKYAIVMKSQSTSSGHRTCWIRDESDPTYPGGCHEYASDITNWVSHPDRDLLFEEWGEPVGPTIQTQDATNIKSDEAMLHTKVLDDQGKTLSVRHNWGKTTGYGENTPWQEGKHTDDLISQKITGLDPVTEYHFRGEAIFED